MSKYLEIKVSRPGDKTETIVHHAPWRWKYLNNAATIIVYEQDHLYSMNEKPVAIYYNVLQCIEKGFEEPEDYRR